MRSSLAIPSEVPLKATGAGDPKAIEVIRPWTDALRRSDVDRASALWSVPDDPDAPRGAPDLADQPGAPIV